MNIDTRGDRVNRLINLRGQREQSLKFAFGFKGGMKLCYTHGCEIFTPLSIALKGANLSDVIIFDKMINGEVKAESWMW
jgi:hypothetical protein